MATPKILVVDDQPINVQLLKRKLEREGMAIATAYSGQEALKLVAGDKPDLILLDVMMPEMDGVEVCQRLQASDETKSIPIIFITARTSKEGKIEGLGAGAVDYITRSTASLSTCSAASAIRAAPPPSAPSPKASPTISTICSASSSATWTSSRPTMKSPSW
jgi:CheY-like chemotaxis protein